MQYRIKQSNTHGISLLAEGLLNKIAQWITITSERYELGGQQSLVIL
ncbi:MAG: hypothetical protein GPJ54_01680 [Candidatus Heimdallarchaeota archaeon]|nr:hypothetical protein [Candidatus Heimdallarchaeota archaeon]